MRMNHVRITPAHAGKSLLPHPGTPLCWDHPRTRGEKLRISSLQAYFAGSPPHTRGKDGGLPPRRGGRGITPAHAGTRPPGPPRSARRRDLPSTRGEKSASTAAIVASAGSPPHTRGKAGVGGCTPVAGGITPAHAGKRCSRRTPSRQARDHPRTRGEKGIHGQPVFPHPGSPPHTRGKGVFRHVGGASLGITPAHAGKRLNGSRF